MTPINTDKFSIYGKGYLTYNHLFRKETTIMFRLWCKIFHENHLVKDTVICNDDPDMSRTQKIFAAIESACYEFDLGKPIWLESNVESFKRHSKVRFMQDNFIDSIDFDYLEIQVIEED